MILGCADCGESLPYVEVDVEVDVGDKLVGVIFRFYSNRAVRVRSEDEEHFNSIDKRKWLKKIQKFVLETGTGICPQCRKEAYVDE